MDVISSTEFRKTYARLTKPTKVTVSGHTIGVWTPGGPNPDYDDMPDVLDKEFRSPITSTAIMYNTRPFTPVPKKRK